LITIREQVDHDKGSRLITIREQVEHERGSRLNRGCVHSIGVNCSRIVVIERGEIFSQLQLIPDRYWPSEKP
jgi:hypothetical protein